MALSASGLFVKTFELILFNTIAVDLNHETGVKIALLNNSGTPAFDTMDYWNDLSTNEVYGTNWAQGGVSLTNTAFTSTGGSLLWDADNVSVASTTLAASYGAVIYDDLVTTPTADAMICLVYFGGSPYSTTNGTFAITWSTSPNCIFSIDMTP